MLHFEKYVDTTYFFYCFIFPEQHFSSRFDLLLYRKKAAPKTTDK